MSTSQFRSGDEVVYIGKSEPYAKIFKGSRYILKRQWDEGRWVFENNNIGLLCDREIVLADLYYSPLYQALL